jgi:succinyl-CoA synthetase beta subunit
LNPLVKLTTGEVIATDARMIIDDNALFRHDEFRNRVEDRIDDTPREAEGRKLGLAYVDLPGNIGIIGNGAGLTMATVDIVTIMGGKPANFLDIGGGARIEVIRDAVKLVMSKPEVKAVLVNILGGITRCDVVAQGVIAGMNAAAEKKPVAVRMVGTNEEEGVRLLREAGITAYTNMEDAIARVITL